MRAILTGERIGGIRSTGLIAQLTMRKGWTHPELPWLLVAGLVIILALIDRFLISDQRSPIDQALDWTTILTAILGSCGSWVVSYRAPLRTVPAQRAVLTIRIVLCWVLGPFCVVGAAFPAHDIDGGLLLVYPPFLGLVLTIFLLPWLFLTRPRRLARRGKSCAAHSDS
jgi:hypothetical protein